ncbi:MAG: branched-chain amino acid ABC transporter permease [Candidatus Bathyarchaeia archaeon]
MVFLKGALGRNISKIIYLSLVIMALICAFPLFVDVERSYPIYFLYYIFMYIAISQSWNMVSGFAGQFSLGHSVFFGIGAYVTALSYSRGLIGYFDFRSFLLGPVVSAIIAIVVGYPLLGRLKGLYFALGTLGLNEVVKQLIIVNGEYTGGATGVQLPSSVYAGFMPYYYTALIIMILSSLLAIIVSKVKIGLNFRAIRDDEIAAESVGIPTLHYKILAFSLSAIFPAACGVLYAYNIFHVQPDSAFSMNWSLDPALMTMLGGVGTIFGPIIGSIIYGLIIQLISLYFPTIHPLISGLLLILVVIAMPKGIVDVIDRARHKFSGRSY